MPEEKQKLTQEELLWKIYENSENTRKYLMWNRIFSVIKILIFIIPLILAIIYLPPLLQNAFSPYKELLDSSTQGKEMLDNLDIDSLLKMYK